MKATSKTLIPLFFLALSTIGFSQKPVAIVEYVKVKPGNNNDYLALEKEARKVHQVRVDQGIISSWGLYKKMFTGADDPYQYIIVHIYDNFKKTEKPMPWKWINEQWSEEQQKDFSGRAVKSRTIVKKEVYFLETEAENIDFSTYLFINRMKTKSGKSAEYGKFEREMVKPVFEEAIARGIRSSWSVWHKWLDTNEFDYVTVDGYAEYGQWLDTWNALSDAVKKVHPDLDPNELLNKAGELRSGISRELWKSIDFVGAEEN